jgi:hypothetical protein
MYEELIVTGAWWDYVAYFAYDDPALVPVPADMQRAAHG